MTSSSSVELGLSSIFTLEMTHRRCFTQSHRQASANLDEDAAPRFRNKVPPVSADISFPLHQSSTIRLLARAPLDRIYHRSRTRPGRLQSLYCCLNHLSCDNDTDANQSSSFGWRSIASKASTLSTTKAHLRRSRFRQTVAQLSIYSHGRPSTSAGVLPSRPSSKDLCSIP